MAGVNPLDAPEIEKIREFLGLSHLEIDLRANWGSQFPNHRENIHGELKKKMAKAHPLSDSSISHCHSLGGFAFIQFDSSRIVQIGFDLEESSRVSEPVARRICKTIQEYDRAPSCSSLWTAKEAAFKSLKGPRQPQTLSQLELGTWSFPASQFETVSVTEPEFYSCSRIQGVVIKKDFFTFAFFISTP